MKIEEDLTNIVTNYGKYMDGIVEALKEFYQ